jgi:hypothetical protein
MWKQSKHGFGIALHPFAWVILVACTSCGYPALEPLCGDIICGPGQVCAANQTVCIDVGGCGNGLIDNNEVCDDGNIVDGEMDTNGVLVLDQCSHNCTSTQECGNGIQDMGETCDHGKLNGTTSDFCDISCHIPCGNGVVDQDSGEQCDPTGGADTSTCNGKNAGAVSCHFAGCGDGYANAKNGEACDNGAADTFTCNGSSANPVSTRCQPAICGDSHVNVAAGEQCDRGADTSTCNGSTAGSASCQFPACGDGHVNTLFKPTGATRAEECDTGVPCVDAAKTCTNCNCM